MQFSKLKRFRPNDESRPLPRTSNHLPLDEVFVAGLAVIDPELYRSSLDFKGNKFTSGPKPILTAYRINLLNGSELANPDIKPWFVVFTKTSGKYVYGLITDGDTFLPVAPLQHEDSGPRFKIADGFPDSMYAIPISGMRSAAWRRWRRALDNVTEKQFSKVRSEISSWLESPYRILWYLQGDTMRRELLLTQSY